MKRTTGILVMMASWLVALAAVVGLVYVEFAGLPGKARPVEYQAIVAAQGDKAELDRLLATAHQEWYVVTLLVGLVLAAAAFAYLMYVKYVEEPYGQEATVLGLSRGAGAVGNGSK